MTRTSEPENWTAWLEVNNAPGDAGSAGGRVDAKLDVPIADPFPTQPIPVVAPRGAETTECAETVSAPTGVVAPPMARAVGPSRCASRGPRRWIFRATAGLWNPGPSAVELEHDALIERLQRSPGRHGYRIATLVLKGGVGKTTVTAALAATFGRHITTTSVVLMDGNPQTGTACKRVAHPSGHDVLDLLADPLLVSSDQDGGRRPAAAGTASDVAVHTGRSRGRFEVLAGPRSVAAAHGLARSDYELTMQVLERFYGIVLTDCGTDLRHDITLASLDSADAVVIVVEPERGSVELAADTLRFLHDYPTDAADDPMLDAEGNPVAAYRHLVERAVVVVNRRQPLRPGRECYGVADIAAAFGGDQRRVLSLPYDPHLGTGGEIDLDLVAPATARALLRIAAAISDDFPAAAVRHRSSASPRTLHA